VSSVVRSRRTVEKRRAKTIEVKASHVSLIAHPDAITGLIREAAQGTTRRMGLSGLRPAQGVSRPVNASSCVAILPTGNHTRMTVE
jgi:hypothetical protein